LLIKNVVRSKLTQILHNISHGDATSASAFRQSIAIVSPPATPSFVKQRISQGKNAEWGWRQRYEFY
jgi:hypothetical protein